MNRNPDRARLMSHAVAILSTAMPCVAQATLRCAAREDGRRQSFSALSHARSMSPDGRWLAFASDSSSEVGVFLRDLLTGELFPVSIGLQGNLRGGFLPTVTSDGSRVAFLSADGELVPNDTNQQTDVFVWTRATRSLARANVDGNGSQSVGLAYSAVISRDGSTVAFSSYAGDLVPGDTNGELDFFMHHLATGLTLRVSEGSNGQQGLPTCSSPGPLCVTRPKLDVSDDGRFIAFESWMTNLVPNDSAGLDVFVHDWFTGTTQRVSEAAGGGNSTGSSSSPSISGDGRWVAFHAIANDLVPGAGPGAYLRDLASGVTSTLGFGPNGSHIGGGILPQPVLSQNGHFVAFVTDVDLLVPDDQDGQVDLFVQRLGSTQIELVSRGAGGSNLSNSTFDWNSIGSPAHGVTNDGRVMFRAAASAIVGEPSPSPFTVALHDPLMRTNAVSDYCTAKTNSLGCVPRMTVCGAPSMSAGQRFALIAENVRSHKTGFLVWSTSSLAAPFDGGTLCIGTPRRRTPAQDSGGASGADDCTGAYSFWFDSTYVTSVGLAPGDAVHAQYYSRDPWPFSPNNSGLTNAIRFVVLP